MLEGATVLDAAVVVRPLGPEINAFPVWALPKAAVPSVKAAMMPALMVPVILFVVVVISRLLVPHLVWLGLSLIHI